ncbi:hypothetical protein DL98DRAFT_599142 [Cadophora sp. DSE1049]|nr:hypothetical protein DL98DRAFT_599142 [Cadophora sp. DSE1049]
MNSQPACVSCQDVISCSDSPLSVTGNVIGILTFVGAFLVTVQVYFNSMRNAERNIHEMTETLHSRIGEVRHLEKKVKGSRAEIDDAHRERIESALNQVHEPMESVYRLLERIDEGRYDGKRRLWLRAQFILREDLIKEGLEKSEKAMGLLREAANDVLTSVESEPTRHEIAFRDDILRQLAQMRTEIWGLKESNANKLGEVRDLLRDFIGQRPSTGPEAERAT